VMNSLPENLLNSDFNAQPYWRMVILLKNT
jgi:hypothetical protein